jgi:hypothetical protein
VTPGPRHDEARVVFCGGSGNCRKREWITWAEHVPRTRTGSPLRERAPGPYRAVVAVRAGLQVKRKENWRRLPARAVCGAWGRPEIARPPAPGRYHTESRDAGSRVQRGMVPREILGRPLLQLLVHETPRTDSRRGPGHQRLASGRKRRFPLSGGTCRWRASTQKGGGE